MMYTYNQLFHQTPFSEHWLNNVCSVKAVDTVGPEDTGLSRDNSRIANHEITSKKKQQNNQVMNMLQMKLTKEIGAKMDF